MHAFSIVRFRVKPGRKEEFIEAHKKAASGWPGLVHANLVQIGERGYCLVAEWESEAAMQKAGPKLIKTLDGFRATLEVLGPKIGVAATLAGPAVLEMK